MLPVLLQEDLGSPRQRPASGRELMPETETGKRKREPDNAEKEVEVPEETAVAAADGENKTAVVVEEDESGLDERQKTLRRLQRKMTEARKLNEVALIAEKKRQEAPKEERGVTKQKWFEEKQKQAGKRLEFSGIDKSKMYMLETQEAAEANYKKREKKPTPFGWDGKLVVFVVFNQRALYNAYMKRAKNIPNTLEEYGNARDADPEFYCDETSLQYGKTPEYPKNT